MDQKALMVGSNFWVDRDFATYPDVSVMKISGCVEVR